jgi:hypothetical protein
MPPGEQAVNADVLVKQGPMNADAASDQAPASSFALAAVEKTRIPDERDHYRSAVLKRDGELVLRHFDVHRAGALKVTR